jgi:hypothetical protein
MFCSKCGHQNPDEAQFCGSCGGPLAAPASSSSPASPAGGTPFPPRGTGGKAVSDGLKIGVIVGSLIIPLLGIIMGVIFLVDANPEKKAVGRLWLIVGVVAFVVWCIFSAILAAIGAGY